MADLRKDPITGRWVIIASERAKRPRDFLSERSIKPTGVCPLCTGNEGMTPPEILAYRGNGGVANTPGWTLRVVPNRFPALRIEGNLDRRGQGMFDLMNGVGAHEVIIETQEHDRDLPDLDQTAIEGVMRAFRERSVDLRKDSRFQYVLIFRNHGESAGATLEHPHSQLIATPVVPIRVASEINGCRKYFELRERCVFCDMVREEIASHQRIVLENDRFVVIAPFASRFPFESWIIPKEHRADFGTSSPADLSACGAALRETLRRMRQVLDDPPYNFVIHTSPIQLRDKDEEVYHWHIEVMPRLTRVAGFEWGSGFYINPTPPEEAAEFMRGASV